MQENRPAASAVAVQVCVAGPVTVTVEPGVAVPLTADPFVGLTTGAGASEVSTTVVVGRLVLPAASLAVTDRVSPLAGAGVGEQDHVPAAVATAVHTVVAPFLTVTVEPGSAVPFTKLPLVGLTTGAAGAVPSVVTPIGAVDGLLLPAGSVCAAAKLCAASANAAAGVHVQLPALSTTPEHTVAAPSLTVTVAPGSPVPVKVGVVSEVKVPAVGAVNNGTAGATVSTVRACAAEAEPMLPAGSVCFAEMECRPSVSGLTGVQDHTPAALTTPLQIAVAPSDIVTVAPISPVPVKVGVVPLMAPPAAGVVMTGATGAVVSMVTVTGVDEVLALPAASTAETVMG